MTKILLKNIESSFTESKYILIVGLGFDQRCLSVSNALSQSVIERYVGVSNAGWAQFNQKNIQEFKTQFGSKGEVLGDGAKSILEVADELSVLLIKLKSTSLKILIDISVMSHELLVVLLGALKNLEMLNRVTLLYVGASEYSVGSNPENVWLSRGVSSIRSILGFPGVMYPSKRLHLVIMSGFEVDRAKEVITCFEPASLSIGVGGSSQSVSGAHYQKNQFFSSRLKEFINEQDAYNSSVEHFEFSCVDPFEVKNQVLSHVAKIRELSNDNIVICPLNTKLSTVGVALAALEDQTIQICYAEPEEYNVDGYALPGEDVSVISLENV